MTGDRPTRETLAGFLDDAALLTGAAAERDRPAAALAAHRAHLRSWYRDLVGAFVLPPQSVREVLDSLDGEDHGLRVVLATGASGIEAHHALARIRLARDTILDDSRLDLVGVEVPLPLGGLFDVQGIRETTRSLLDALDFSAPTRIDLGTQATLDAARRGDLETALEVIAEDAAEEVALPPTAASDLLDRARKLGLRVRGSVAATGDGLVGPAADAATSGLRGIAVPSVAAAVAELAGAGLIDPADEG